ncbi:hypothetical protein Goarm_006417 [Gossypium armourianum]|uniref:Uncharacterized protein n=1 Tax=Gossypium armourianum TaxID=34283 RepID=A0A7J9JHX8_9ROSI|nr:hypothetical protein [Gossypium armourianum]
MTLVSPEIKTQKRYCLRIRIQFWTWRLLMVQVRRQASRGKRCF